MPMIKWLNSLSVSRRDHLVMAAYGFAAIVIPTLFQVVYNDALLAAVLHAEAVTIALGHIPLSLWSLDTTSSFIENSAIDGGGNFLHVLCGGSVWVGLYVFPTQSYAAFAPEIGELTERIKGATKKA
ncbi:hypothetical protein [Bradyrhizobium sp. S69]|jgi:hypothetical protein|uniref:hypothetical protein n=1 Tax=Bradyrhizobium sp. S69 TaxID=1641856 RepID=UPI00131E0FBC|nr:hypothetical protein [Bradyrhizobium sp. S69]